MTGYVCTLAYLHMLSTYHVIKLLCNVVSNKITCVCFCKIKECTQVHTDTQTCARTHAHPHAHPHAHTHACTHTHTHTHVHTHAHTYTYTHIHTYTYTHVHTHCISGLTKTEAIMLVKLSIILFSNSHNFTYYSYIFYLLFSKLCLV